jgi:hypothetical protein
VAEAQAHLGKLQQQLQVLRQLKQQAEEAQAMQEAGGAYYRGRFDTILACLVSAYHGVSC